MAFSSATISIGGTTKKADYDRLMANTVHTLKEVATFVGAKTFTTDPLVDGIDARTATGSVSLEVESLDEDGQGGKLTLKTKIVEIGGWDMDTDASVNPVHNITPSKVRGVWVIIQNDDQDEFYQIATRDDAAAPTTLDAHIHVITTGVFVGRRNGGLFDDTAFDDDTINRGWITIIYEE